MTPHDPAEVTVRSTGLTQLARGAAARIAVRDVGGSSRQGPRRERNEDAWAFAAGTAFVVADGMGGRPAGDLAANAAVDALLERLTNPVDDWQDLVRATNDAVIERTRDRGAAGSGAVAIGMRIADNRVTVLHIGDTRAYRLRDGNAQQLTRDHSVRELMAEHGLRRSQTGLGGRELRALTAYLGDEAAWEEHSVHELTVRDGDRLVLCSDGVHDVLDPTTWQLASVVPSAGEAAAFLTGTAHADGGTDDATALVVDLGIER